MLQLRIQAVASRLHIKLPSMPGTGDDILFHDALRERASRMRADPVHGVKISVQLKQRDDPPRDYELAPLSAWDFGNAGNSKTTHSGLISCKCFGDDRLCFLKAGFRNFERILFPVVLIEQFKRQNSAIADVAQSPEDFS